MRKRLIICCDGTWNKPYAKEQPTNVTKTVWAILPVDRAAGMHQVVFYGPGVGTGNALDRVLGGGFGVGLSENVKGAYLFLVANYEPEDEIFLFGFSRGAFTVRSLAGLIGAVGVLHKADLARFPDAYKYYRTSPAQRTAAVKARLLPTARHENVPVHFLGVWDTVGALGVPFGPLNFIARSRYGFHDVALGSAVKNAYHALAIDERRRSFAPAIWDKVPEGSTVEQVWFSGVHSNVGGGYPNTRLSNTAWLWMMDKAQACGLVLDPGFLAAAAESEGRSVLYDSRGWAWKFRRPLVREMLVTHLPSERIHSSVLDRCACAPSAIEPHPYAPENLEACKGLCKAKRLNLSDFVV
jgi:uncharacterized protein (DUF2235 family)